MKHNIGLDYIPHKNSKVFDDASVKFLSDYY